MSQDRVIPNIKEIIALEGDPELKRQLQDQLGDLLAQKREMNFGWASVEDELPEAEVGVLVLDQTKTQSQAWWDGSTCWWSSMTECQLTVTHWRHLLPLPIHLHP